MPRGINFRKCTFYCKWSCSKTGLIFCFKGSSVDVVGARQGSLCLKREAHKFICKMLTNKNAFVQTALQNTYSSGCCCKRRDFPQDGSLHQALTTASKLQFLGFEFQIKLCQQEVRGDPNFPSRDSYRPNSSPPQS